MRTVRLKKPASEQQAWLESQRGRYVTARLSDSKTVSGVLVGHDAYCLCLQNEEGRAPLLVYKQHVAYLRDEPHHRPIDKRQSR